MPPPTAAECCSCGQEFGPDCRPAVAHNCGHTPCQSCVQAGPSSESRCGACRKRSKSSQDVIKELRVPGEGGQPLRIWCVDCDSLPTDLCLSEHHFCNVQRLVRDSARSVAAMHDAVAAGLQRAQQGLQGLRTWANGAEDRQDLSALRAHAACLGRIQGVLQQALQDVEEEARRCQAQDATSSNERYTLGASMEFPSNSSNPSSGIPPESRASLESLPRELLQAVLAYVPIKQLLPLRLLGRRWKTLILEEPLWRHRRLNITLNTKERPYAAILRMAPALDTLKLETVPPNGAHGLVLLKALARGQCKVRFLDLYVGASAVSSQILSNVFSSRSSSLQQLHLHSAHGSDLGPALDAIDALKELKSLKLIFMQNVSPGFTFKRLRLTNLNISTFVKVDMARDLIRLGRDTLTSIKCDVEIKELKTDLVLCKKLTHLTVGTPCEGLDEVVPQLPLLQSITIQESFRLSPSTVTWFRWAERNFSGKVHFVLDYWTADSTLTSSTDSLRNVHSVTINRSFYAVMRPEPLAQFLMSLTAVEQLVLNFGTDYESLLRSWPASTVPRLQCLSICSHYQNNASAFRISFAQAIKAWRPNLKLKFL
ncbi:uncharacterized protein LOC117646902 [Thrips palmi]|uniref:Uncharacterized protein LOC117646902 n=1 Tax=Thrips palmi TaxID=161013 RepID=A0A6P8Z325_THRPL|nr:uncharacterized protein LOC117646902 [Thrips palmi]